MNGSGCPSCNNSIGEFKIDKFLRDNNILFEREKTFDDCRSIKDYKLRFDFWVPALNMCIEYDGLQHEQEIKWFGKESFENTKRNDVIKEDYLKNKGINLLRIKHKDRNKIDKILVQELYPIFESNN